MQRIQVIFRTTTARPAHRGRCRQGPAFSGAYTGRFTYRQREADREIAAFMARSGGRFTDSMERELSTRMFTGDWQRHPHAGL